VKDRIRSTFAPLLVGLLGGSVISGTALLSLVVLLRNCAATYSHFPHLPRPWLAMDLALPGWLLVPLAVLGMVLPFAMGLATVWLARPRDVWDDVSAGLTTALASTLSSFAAGIGWAVILAMTIVPSIADLTWFGQATRQPAAGPGHAPHPSAVLVEHYPDLADVPADERGGRFMAKIVSDQVMGSAWGIWLGLLTALATCGTLGFCGTLAAGYLWRRGDSLRGLVLPYLELTVSSTLLVGLLLREALVGRTLGREIPHGVLVLWLALLTAVVVIGVVQRWRWPLRLTLAITWGVVFLQAMGGRVPWYLAGVVCIGCAALLVRHWIQQRQPALPATA